MTIVLSDDTAVAEAILNERALLDCNQAYVALFDASSKDDLRGTHPSQLSPEYQVSGEVSSELASRYITECFEQGHREFDWVHTMVTGSLFSCRVELRLLENNTLLARLLEPRISLGESNQDSKASAISPEQGMAFRESYNLLHQHKRAIDVSAIVSKTDTHGNITYVNNMFCDVSGYSHNELLGENHNIVNHPGMPKEVFADLWRTIRSGKVWHGVILNRRKDGSNYYVSSTISPIRGSNGEIIEYIAIRHDITDLYEKDRIIQIQTTDIETGLPNRVQFNDDLRRRSGAWIAVLSFAEIEGVQQIYGDIEYESFIKNLTSMLTEYSTNIARVYRTSESYFALICESDCEQKTFVENCEKIVEKILEQPMVLADNKIYLSVKVGVAENDQPEKTYGHACLAMNSAYQDQDSIGIYHQGTKEYQRLSNAIYWAGKLKSAISRGRIQIYGQGIFCADGKRYSTEVLMRYQSGYECVSPIVFLDYAKSAGIYSSLTHEVIRQSFNYFKDSGQRFSINLDREDLFNKTTRGILLDHVRDSGCGDQLTLELLESSGVDFSNTVVKNFIAELKSLNCQIAIDDFGSGYSNFDYLATTDVDLIKIDGSLIRDILQNKKHHLIVQSIVTLCKSLDIPVVAEFSAEKDIIDLLIEFGVDYFQGYYFEKPVPLT